MVECREQTLNTYLPDPLSFAFEKRNWNFHRLEFLFDSLDDCAMNCRRELKVGQLMGFNT